SICLHELFILMMLSVTVLIAVSFSMAVLPPFYILLSKVMFFISVLNISQLDIFSLDTWGILFPVVACTASLLTFVYCLIIVFKTFFGEYKGRTITRKQLEPPKGMLLSPVILTLLILGIFFFPNVVGKYIIFPA